MIKIEGTLAIPNLKRRRVQAIMESAVLICRVRGLHLKEKNIFF